MDPQNGPMFEASPEMQDAGCWHALRHLTSIVSLVFPCAVKCHKFAVQGKGTFWERDANLIEQLEHLYHVSFTDVPVCSVCLLVFGSQCHHVGPRGQ